MKLEVLAICVNHTTLPRMASNWYFSPLHMYDKMTIMVMMMNEGDEGLQLSSEPSWDMMQPQIKAC